MPLLGAHMSIAGGLVRALERGQSVGCETVQIFTKNNNQWRSRDLTKGETADFRGRLLRGPIRVAFAHDSYLINLASPDPNLLEWSRLAFVDELERAREWGLQYLVLHPGAHLGLGEEEGIRQISKSFDWIFEKTPSGKVRVLIETTAGQGTSLGKGFLGLRPFQFLLNDPRFKNHPMVLETPKGKDDAWDRENLRVLRDLLQ